MRAGMAIMSRASIVLVVVHNSFADGAVAIQEIRLPVTPIAPPGRIVPASSKQTTWQPVIKRSIGFMCAVLWLHGKPLRAGSGRACGLWVGGLRARSDGRLRASVPRRTLH